MKLKVLVSSFLILGVAFVMNTTPSFSQNSISVGRGSYAAYTPLSKCKSTDHSGDQSLFMQYRKLYVHERAGQPIPTNDWWTNMITDKYSGQLWSYPQVVHAYNYGVSIGYPSYWTDDGCEMKSNSTLVIGGVKFSPDSAIAESWHDWDVEMNLINGDKRMLVTMAHGMPFTWVETTGIQPQITLGSDASLFDENGNAISLPSKTDKLAVKIGNDIYGIFMPANTLITNIDGKMTMSFSGSQQYFSVALLNSLSDLVSYSYYAYSVPRETKVTWSYSPSEGKVNTHWNVIAENLKGEGETAVLQGFLPHHYKHSTLAFAFNDITYATPRGEMKIAAGNTFDISYTFSGMLPYFAAPAEADLIKNPFNRRKMLALLTDYANGGTFGGDTYWGGKGLVQMAQYMMFAREMGETALFEQCRDKLKGALVNWLTYTPGEDNFFFARYDRWGGLVGYNTSYDSDTFNDHHFHYGYFTYAGALLALVDDDFKQNYGGMLKLLAKDYANWDRTDKAFPLFRTFDPWAGHSFAGGMGDGNGNGQESSSGAMQSWGGLYLLGVALGDDEMRDAGLFGWASEARGTAEYWFDRDKTNIDYTKYKHPYNSNLTCQGIGWWTWFSGDPVWMHSIQWMPISPCLDYLDENLDFTKSDYMQMWQGKDVGGWRDTTSSGCLGNESGLGNVVLSYLQRFDVDSAAAVFDNLWDGNMPLAKNRDTGGISYFAIHSHATYGDIDWSTYASIPTARTFKRAKDGKYTYMAYNPTDNQTTVKFYRGGNEVFSLDAPARQLTVSGRTSEAVTEIVQPSSEKGDPLDSIQMINIALGKTCTSSSEENVGTVTVNATDGNMSTRWGSNHTDNQWITVDLGENAYIHSLVLHWETAYPSEYKIMLSADGNDWNEYKTVNSDGGEDDIPLDGASARYIKIVGVKRATAYGISLYEMEAFGKLSSMTDDDILGVRLTADKEMLKQGETTQIYAEGYTCGGKWVNIIPSWSSSDGDITAQGLFTPSKYGTASVGASVGKSSFYKTFPVEEGLKLSALSISPKSPLVILGDKQKFTIEATDQFGAPFDTGDIEYKIVGEGAKFESPVFSATTGGTYKLIVGSGTIAATASITVLPISEVNLAYNKPAEASSVENAVTIASAANDGDIKTRWSSQCSDDQYIQIDLLNTYKLNKIKLYWETSHAKSYRIDVSLDGGEWSTVYSSSDCSGEPEALNFAETAARYVRLVCLTRSNDYGYSIYEEEIYGTSKIDDSPSTSISAVHRYDINDSGNAYTIDGRKVNINNIQRGIYVINNKKEIIK